MMKFSKIALSTLAVAGSFLLAQPASAEDLDVSASVASSCVIVTAPVNFGAYDVLTTHASAPLLGAGSVTVSCTSGSTATILLDAGLTPDAASTDAVPLRQMDNGTDVLAYHLYTDTGRLDVWGNTDLTGVDHLGTGTTSGAIPVYGSIPGGQNVSAGDYVDTVQATVTF